ncbi:MAG: hypothetical protein AB7P03_11680 [Kofleriaceae bacterium]
MTSWLFRTSLAIFALTGCGDSSDSTAPITPPDLSGVTPEFRPTTKTMTQLMAIAGRQLTDIDPGAPGLQSFAREQLQQIGLATVRGDLFWHEVEPVAGARDYSQFGANIDALASAGVATLPILGYGTAWSTSDGEVRAPATDLNQFASYAEGAAEALHGRVPAYEIWNEPNLGFQFWKPVEDPDRYGALLKTAAAAIRKVDPDMPIVFAGLLYHGLVGSTPGERFLEQVYAAHPDISSSFDVFAFHPYALYPPSVAPEVDDADRGEVALTRMVARMRAELVHYGYDPAPPLWVTEIGWASYQGVTEELQARWLVRAALLLAGAGVERVFWYTMFDGPNPTAFPPEDAFGMFHWDADSSDGFSPAPKPAWTALSTLLATTGTLAVTSDVTSTIAGAPADVMAYQLTDPTGASPRRVTVVWRADDAAPAVSLSLPITPTQIIDMLGQAVPISSTIDVSGRPIYVVEQ